MRETFTNTNFHKSSQKIIDQANEIIDQYTNQGYTLTLRQLYYQFVSRDLLPNNQKSYSRLGDIINNARLAGEIDWESIEDRTRNIVQSTIFDKPEHVIQSASYWYQTDHWCNQHHRVEVWIEKDALSGLIEQVCSKYQVPYIACRGYMSQSEMYTASKRIMDYINNKDAQEVTILHLGDHDPSGIDMTRDIENRLAMFLFNGDDPLADDDNCFHVKRIALTYEQVRRYNPPENPAKMTDSRFEQYMALYGDKSWELDALEPRVINDLIESNILSLLESKKYNAEIAKEKDQKTLIRNTAIEWPAVAAMVDRLVQGS